LAKAYAGLSGTIVTVQTGENAFNNIIIVINRKSNLLFEIPILKYQIFQQKYML